MDAGERGHRVTAAEWACGALTAVALGIADAYDGWPVWGAVVLALGGVCVVGAIGTLIAYRNRR